MNLIQPLEFLLRPESSAIIWLNGHVGNKLTDRLWNTAKVRYAADGAANIIYADLKSRLLEAPHKVVGDMDSIAPKLLEQLKANGLIEHITEQDTTDMTKSFRALLRDHESDANISNIIAFGGLKGRFDHVLAAIKTLVAESKSTTIPLAVLHDVNLVTVLSTGSHRLKMDADYEKYLTGTCGLVPICQRETRVTTRGFHWDLTDTSLTFEGLISTSNQIENSVLFVETTGPLVFTLELREELLEISL